MTTQTRRKVNPGYIVAGVLVLLMVGGMALPWVLPAAGPWIVGIGALVMLALLWRPAARIVRYLATLS